MASLAAALEVVVHELFDECFLGREVEEGTFREGKFEPVGVHMAEVARSDLANGVLLRQEDGPDEARQVARRFEHTRVQRLDEDDGRPVARDRQDLSVQRRLDVEHSNLPFRPGSTGADCSTQ